MQIKYNDVEEEYKKKLDKLFGVENCLIEVNPGNILLPPKYEEIGERILNLEVKFDDVWLVSYPRTGSTWAQEMVWCIINNLDYEGAKLLSQFRAPLLELTALFGNDKREWKNALGNSVEQVENMPSPRCIKTHLPWDLLPTQLKIIKPKIIYVARNPKDISVSYFHYCNLIHDFHGTYEDFCELFLHGKKGIASTRYEKIIWETFRHFAYLFMRINIKKRNYEYVTAPVGNIWKHVSEFWKRRHEPHILFLKYEDMKKNHKQTIAQVSEFLGKKFAEEEINGLIEHLSFSKMRQNPAINLEPILEKMYDSVERENAENKFIRKGQVGDWRNYMSNELSEKFDEMNEKYWNDIDLFFDN
ncbi:hypothetical protein PGB90_006150 [Kerria lacca]